MDTPNILICPVCRRKHHTEVGLFPDAQGRSWSCRERHSFDMASAGYLNLLPPSGKRTHGDNKEMILARRALLDSRLYQPLRDSLTQLTARLTEPNTVIWDSGCGEGYYTAEVARIGKSIGQTVYGSDLSKEALKSAAKRSSDLRLITASSYDLPAASESCDALLCLFAPQATDEFRRILKPKGIIIQAVPGERHLFGLKQAIYDRPYENTVNREAPKGFESAECIELKQTVTLTDPSLIESLFMMTPYAYRTNIEGGQKVRSLTELTTELHFDLFVYRKTGD